MGIWDEIILSINRRTVPTPHRITSDFHPSVDGYFIDQVSWNSEKFISAKASSKTKGF